MTWATESFLPIDMADIVLKDGHILESEMRVEKRALG